MKTLTLNSPAPWTKDTVRYFLGVARTLCTVAASFGALRWSAG